jgi:hypothetical protein
VGHELDGLAPVSMPEEDDGLTVRLREVELDVGPDPFFRAFLDAPTNLLFRS